VGILLFASSLLYSQQIDPFYLKLLKDGENSFQARNYKEAIKELEIAAFGLHKEKKLAGKAYAYLSLSQYYLKDKEKCEQYLKSAFELLGENGIEGLELDEATRGDLKKLLDFYKLGMNKEAEPAKPKSTPPEEKASSASLKELEKRIKAEPNNVSLSYKLYELYKQRYNLQAAKKVLQALVKKNPNEDQAFYLLAKIDFSQKNYKAALEGFRRALKPSDERQISRELNLKSTIFVILCLYHLNRRQSLGSFFDYLSEAASQEELRQMLKEEGLEEEWEKMRAQISKRSP
jgi:tetratricopeptide (TPR) repeat protein